MTAQADEPLNAPEAKTRISRWHTIDWKRAYREVRRLQIRIAKAVKEKKWHKVRGLIRLLSQSFYAKVLAVRKVTENRGKKTPGVDNIIWDTPEKKWKAVGHLNTRGYTPKPLRRIHIPKQKGGKRPLSIPCKIDLAMQALYQQGLDPVAETLADQNSYGFRRERSCQDAIEQVFNCLFAHKNCAEWILEGDIRSCFSEICHEWLIKRTGFCGGIVRKWLKAGYVYKGRLFPTKSGTPQGGIASPTLMNLTLDGLEGLLKSRFKNSHKVHLIRYCDDFVITGDTEEILIEVKEVVKDFLKSRGLTLSEEKTKITHVNVGFDFLGWNVRKYKGKLIIKPSKANVKRFMNNIRETIKRLKTAKQENLIRVLNRKIRGWSNYHRHVCSKDTFKKVDSLIWEMLRKWCRRRHPNKSSKWIIKRYFHSEKFRNWVFGVKDKEGKWIAKLRKTIDVPIQRHIKIKGEANPYDPEYERYFEKRQTNKWKKNAEGKKLQSLWKKQNGICPICDQIITIDSEWEKHHKIRRTEGGADTLDNLILLHTTCHIQLHHNPELTAGRL